MSGLAASWVGRLKLEQHSPNAASMDEGREKSAGRGAAAGGRWPACAIEHLFVHSHVDRTYEIESLRRSLAMLQPGATAGLRREDAINLIEEIQDRQSRLEQLRTELRRLADEGPSPSVAPIGVTVPGRHVGSAGYMVAVAQLVRAPGCGPGGRGFK